MQTISAVTTMLSNHNKTQQRQQSSAMSINSATLRPNRETIANIATTKSLVGPRLRSKSRSQSQSRSKIEIEMYYLRWSDLINLLWQTGHIKFFSPVCVLVCLANSSDRANRFPQPNQEQGKGRSPAKRKKTFWFSANVAWHQGRCDMKYETR